MMGAVNMGKDKDADKQWGNVNSLNVVSSSVVGFH